MRIKEVRLFEEFNGGHDYPENLQVTLKTDTESILEFFVPEYCKESKNFVLFKITPGRCPDFEPCGDNTPIVFEHEWFGIIDDAHFPPGIRNAINCFSANPDKDVVICNGDDAPFAKRLKEPGNVLYTDYDCFQDVADCFAE